MSDTITAAIATALPNLPSFIGGMAQASLPGHVVQVEGFKQWNSRVIPVRVTVTRFVPKRVSCMSAFAFDLDAFKTEDQDAWAAAIMDHVRSKVCRIVELCTASPDMAGALGRAADGWVWNGGYDTKDIPKAAGFRYSDRAWTTTDRAVAERLAEHADPVVRAEFAIAAAA